MPGRCPGIPGWLGRTGCDGSGRGPPSGCCGVDGRTPAGRAPARPAGVAGRAGVAGGFTGAAGGGGGTIERTIVGRAGGACPVFGSSILRRIVGGTTRPVGVGPAGRAGTGCGGAAAAGADAAGATGAWGAGAGSLTAALGARAGSAT